MDRWTGSRNKQQTLKHSRKMNLLAQLSFVFLVTTDHQLVQSEELSGVTAVTSPPSRHPSGGKFSWSIPKGQPSRDPSWGRSVLYSRHRKGAGGRLNLQQYFHEDDVLGDAGGKLKHGGHGGFTERQIKPSEKDLLPGILAHASRAGNRDSEKEIALLNADNRKTDQEPPTQEDNKQASSSSRNSAQTAHPKQKRSVSGSLRLLPLNSGVFRKLVGVSRLLEDASASDREKRFVRPDPDLETNESLNDETRPSPSKAGILRSELPTVLAGVNVGEEGVDSGWDGVSGIALIDFLNIGNLPQRVRISKKDIRRLGVLINARDLLKRKMGLKTADAKLIPKVRISKSKLLNSPNQDWKRSRTDSDGALLLTPEDPLSATSPHWFKRCDNEDLSLTLTLLCRASALPDRLQYGAVDLTPPDSAEFLSRSRRPNSETSSVTDDKSKASSWPALYLLGGAIG